MCLPSLVLLACFFASTICSQAGENASLRAVAATDFTEVHPDSVFDVTVSLENLSDSVQTITVPQPAWDRLWRSSNRHVTWDLWDSDFNEKVTVSIRPHETYTFPSPLKMFVDTAEKKTHIEFRLGYRNGGAFSKTLWSNSLTVEVIP